MNKSKLHDALATVFKTVPADLEAFFDEASDLRDHFEAEVNVLKPIAAVKLTKEFHKFHPVVRALKGFLLDDAETSNHHVYLNHPAVAGSVLFLAHDDDTRIVYASLGDFAAACRDAIECGEPLSERHPAVSPLAGDQAKLEAFVDELHRAGGQTDTIVTLIPSLTLTQVELLTRLVDDKDFYLGEAVARAIAQRPSPALAAVAERAAQHAHPQVAEVAAAALERCRA